MRLLDGSGVSREVHAPFCERLRVKLSWPTHLSKTATTRRGKYLNLYVVMDLFSRYVVAWMISHKENSQLAQSQ